MENHGQLNSGHARSQEKHWTVNLKLDRLALVLTALMLLTIAPPVFGGYHGDMVYTHQYILHLCK